MVQRARRIVQASERAASDFDRVLAIVWKETERRLAGLIRNQPMSTTAIVKASVAQEVRIAIRNAMTDVGFDTLAERATDAPLDLITQRVIDGPIAEAVAQYGATFPQRVAALKALQLIDLLDQGDEAARVIWQAVVRGIFGGQASSVILRDLATVLDKTQAQISTLYDTAVSIFGRQIEALRAPDSPEVLFLYAGPDDELTRPFCEDHVGKEFTRAEIDQMKNGQLNNVFLTGGGYNCRHVWLEVSQVGRMAA